MPGMAAQPTMTQPSTPTHRLQVVQLARHREQGARGQQRQKGGDPHLLAASPWPRPGSLGGAPP